jgi:hypothetical protein
MRRMSRKAEAAYPMADRQFTDPDEVCGGSITRYISGSL